LWRRQSVSDSKGGAAAAALNDPTRSNLAPVTIFPLIEIVAQPLLIPHAALATSIAILLHLPGTNRQSLPDTDMPVSVARNQLHPTTMPRIWLASDRIARQSHDAAYAGRTGAIKLSVLFESRHLVGDQAWVGGGISPWTLGIVEVGIGQTRKWRIGAIPQ
jgi:hypothetical protein